MRSPPQKWPTGRWRQRGPWTVATSRVLQAYTHLIGISCLPATLYTRHGYMAIYKVHLTILHTRGHTQHLSTRLLPAIPRIPYVSNISGSLQELYLYHYKIAHATGKMAVYEREHGTTVDLLISLDA